MIWRKMLKTGDVLGNYQIESAIGKGGMGMVYLAYDLRLERQVAVKVINSEKYQDEQSNIRERFAVEARALAKLNDRHIVQIHDFDPDHNPPYLVMEYVTGRNLSQIIARDKRLPIAQVLDAAAQILSGLNIAHRSGIIHRDIKPNNILLTSNGTYKLVDFGLARGQQSSPKHKALTEDSTVLGTLQYLAPEVAQGQAANECSDIYSLAITLYHMATGQCPFESNNKLELIKFIANDSAPCISTHIQALPKPLIDWFNCMMAFKIEDRFHSCADALAGLNNIADSINLSGLKKVIYSDSSFEVMPDSGSQDTVLLAGQGSAPTSPSSIHITTHRPTAPIQSVPIAAAPDVSISKFHIGFSLKILIAFWLISSIGTFFAINYIATETLSEQMAQLKHQLRTSAHAASILIDGDVHGNLRQLSDADTDGFKTIFENLVAYRNTNPDILNIYTMAKTDKTDSFGIVQFICDASPLSDDNNNNFIDPEESVADLGEEYNAGEDAPMLLKGFEEICTDEDITVDKWGAVLSGYAPIRDKNGNSTGLVGIDVSSNIIIDLKSRSNNRALIIQLISFITFLIAAIFLARRFNRPVKSLQESLLAAADGDYSKDVTLNGYSEFHPLAKSINKMLEELREKDTLRRAYELFVAREMHGSMSGNTSSSNIRSDHEQYLSVLCTFDNEADNCNGQQFEKTLSKTISVFFDHGGVIDQMLGNGLLATFERDAKHQHIEEQAIRAAIQAQSIFNEQSQGGKLTISIHKGEDEHHHLLSAINKIAVLMPCDILISEETFKPVQMMFYADRLNDVNLPQQTNACLYAIKGSVSA